MRKLPAVEVSHADLVFLLGNDSLLVEGRVA